MARFMIYLLETGLCLSLLYLAYWLFLRKETYFNFNRLYLVGSLGLALGVPLLHVSFIIPQGSSLESPARNIVKFRSGYEEVIRLIDADFGTEPGARHALTNPSENLSFTVDEGNMPRKDLHGRPSQMGESESTRGMFSPGMHFSLSGILLLIYLGGVCYFLVRLAYLLIRLFMLAKQNRVIRQDGFRMIEIREDISPFSFFRFLYINKESLSGSEFQQVLEHEKAHIRQKHSMDHLFAHGLSVFQWFNPFAWQMRKALKTTHEYIADRQVLMKGMERLDYQALLLKQVIGYHSVELVNNFNLKPIKQRIAMMNKAKSGIPAKFKAMLVIPFALSLFFLFADFTLKESNSFPDPLNELSGLWIKQSEDNFSHMIYVNEGRFSYVDGHEIKNYEASLMDEGKITFNNPGESWTTTYRLSGDQLYFSWNPRVEESLYLRSEASNSLDQLLLENHLNLNLPSISQYRLLEDEQLIYRIGIGPEEEGGAKITLNGQVVPLSEISRRINTLIGELSLPDMNQATGIFLVDRQVPMKEVDKVRQELREASRFRVAEGGYPHGDLDLSPLLYHSVALPRLLPPLDAKVLDKKVMEELGGKVHTIDLSARNTNPREVEMGIQQFIKNTGNNKYVISLEYDGMIPYGQYVEVVDMIYKVVYSFRNELAQEKYAVPYEKLGDELQKELRRIYPLALSEYIK